MHYSLSHRVTSVVLAVLMIISMITISAFTSFAAQTDTASVSATTYYVAGTMNNWNPTGDAMTQATDISGSTIYYAGPYTQQYQFKVTDGGTNWYGQEIKTNALYDNSLAMYEYGSTGNCWPASSSSYYIVFTTTTSGNAISCVTALPVSGGSSGGSSSTSSTKKPTIYVRDASGNGYALWAWTADNTNLYSASWSNRPTSNSGTLTESGFKAYRADTSIGMQRMYSVKVTKSSSTSVTDAWFETYGHGDLWIDIDAAGNVKFYKNEPGSTVTKSTAFDDAMWVDTQADEVTDETDVTALVKWYERSSGVYRLYLPSGMSLTDVPVYHTYSSLKINGTAVASGGTFTFASGTEYTLSGDVSGKLKVYQSSNVYSMYLNGTNSLPDDTSTAIVSKENVVVQGGSIYTADANGAIVIQDTIKKLKGRGNSSWEASYKLFGKYAFNLTTNSKTNKLTGGAVKTKKYSMLANNLDESMLRNMLIYSLANKIGIDYTPTLRVYDVFDCGNYLGSYTICEKVEVGSSGLLSGITALDDDNAAVNPDIESAAQKTNGMSSTTPGFYKYVDSADPQDITGGYLLEFELSERFDDEISGFVSSQGQAVVCKYPEFATKNEVKYIMDLFNKAEAAVYSSNPDINEISKYIDVESFAKMYLIQEVSKNIDAAQTSYYIYKESDLTGDGKLHAAPVWDYDWTCGQYDGTRPVSSSGETSLIKTSGWTTRYRKIDNNSGKDVNFQAKLCACTDYWNLVKSVWYTNFKSNALTYVFDDTSYTLANSSAWISTTYATVKNSLNMNESRWGFVASDLTTDWGTKDTGDSFDVCIDYLNDWVFDRITWVNSNIGTKASHAVPNLVVSVSDINGVIAAGTADAPTKVDSDVTIKLSDADNKQMLYTLTVGKTAIYPDANGNYNIPVADEGVTEIKYTATSRRASVASTDTDYVATSTATYYVTKESQNLIYGDANLDGNVTIIDATTIQRYLAQLVDFTPDQIKCSDANGNGNVTIMDVTSIQRYLAILSYGDLVNTPVK